LLVISTELVAVFRLSILNPNYASNTAEMNHLKIINASPGPVHEYENVTRTLFNCNANIYFNRQCHQKRLIPNFAKIKIPIRSPAAKSTQRKT